MGRLIAVVAVAVSLLVFSSPAAASCRERAPTPENAARAAAVVYGTVTDASAGALTLRVDRVLKGQIGSSVRVFVGPGRGGVGGMAVATSIDYPNIGARAEVGSDHVLYIVLGADGQLETNACIGSHPGPPDPSEVTSFGLASPSAAPPATSTPVVEPVVSARVVSAPSVIAPALWTVLTLAIIAVGLATLLILRRRRA